MATPPKTRTICVDELGPLRAKTYPGSEWVRSKAEPLLNPIMVDVAKSGYMALLSLLPVKQPLF